MKLVIVEKPSAAQALAKVIGANKRQDGYLEGGGYLVSWCVGHLVELSAPECYDERFSKWRLEDLPILPEHWLYEVTQATRKQYQVLKSLMERSDVESLVCATDAGREGELIFRLVYNQTRCKKPFERLWISSIPNCLVTCLREEKERSNSEFVISDSNGEPLAESQFTRIWNYIRVRSTRERTITRYVNGQPIKKKIKPELGQRCVNRKDIVYSIDFNVTPHQLRHTYITNLIYAGVDPKSVQYLAGHENSKVTMDIYAKAKYNKPEQLSSVVNGALKLPSKRQNDASENATESTQNS